MPRQAGKQNGKAAGASPGRSRTETERKLDERIKELEGFNEKSRDSRLAALNLLEDAVRAKEAVRASEQRQRFLLKLSDALRPLGDALEIERTATRVLGEYLEADRVLYAGTTANGGDVLVADSYVRGDFPKIRGRFKPADIGPTREVLGTGKTYVNHDPQSDGSFPEAARLAADIASVVVVPLIKEGTWVCSLMVQQGTPRKWSALEIALVEETAERTWAAVERARIEEVLRESEERLRLTIEASDLATWEWNLETDEVVWNRRHFTLFGMRPSDGPVSPQEFFRHVNPMDRDRVAGELRYAIENKEPFDTEFHADLDTGETHWMSGFGRVVEQDADGRATKVSGVMADIDERRRTEEALRRSEERYRSIFDSINEGYSLVEVVLDGEGSAVDLIILDANSAQQRLSGVALQVEASVRESFPGFDASWIERLAEVARTGEPQQFQEWFPAAEKWFDIKASRVGNGNRKVAVVFSDITDSKRRERHREMLASVTDDLARLDAVSGTMERLCERVARHFDADLCTFTVIERLTYAHVICEWGADPPRPPTGAQPLKKLFTVRQTSANMAGTVTVVENTEISRHVDLNGFADRGCRSFVTVPVVSDGAWRFMLSVAAAKPRVWLDDEVELMREIADRVWLRMERSRSEDALRRSEAWLAGQKEALQAAVGGAPLAETLGVLVRVANEMTDSDARCAFYIVDETGTELHHVVGMSPAFAERTDGIRIGADSLACGLAAHTRRPVITPDVRLDPQWEEWLEVADEYDIRADWAFPIENEGRVVGTLAMYFNEPREANHAGYETAAVLTQAAAIIISRYQEAEQRARVQEVLRESEERFRNMADHAPVMIWVTDADGACTFLSETWYEFTGQTPETALGNGWMDATHPDDRERTEESFLAANERHEPFRLEYRLRRGDGTYAWAIDSAQPRFAETGEFMGYIGSVLDITERKEAELALSESEARFRGIVNQSVSGIMGTDLDGKFVSANDRFCEIVGYSREELLDGMKLQDITHPDDLSKTVENLRLLVETGTAFEVEKRYIHKSGREVWVSKSAYALTGSSGKPESLAAIVVDVTDRRKAEVVLRRAAELDAFRVELNDALRTLADPAKIQSFAGRLLGEHLKSSRVYYVEIEPDERNFIVASDYTHGVASLAGRYRLSDFGSSILDDFRAGRDVVIEDIANEERIPAASREFCRSVDICSVISIPLVKGGRLSAVLVVDKSATRAWTADEVALVRETAERTWIAVERARAVDALRERESDLKNAQRVARVGSWQWDAATGITVGSEEMFRIFGLTTARAFPTIEEQDGLIFPHNSWQRMNRLVDYAMTTGAGFQVDLPALSGEEPIWVTTRGEVVTDPGGNRTGLRGTVQEITARKMTEQALIESEHRARTLIENLPGGAAFIVDRELRYTLAQGEALASAGLRPQDLLGRSIFDALPEDIAAYHEPRYRAALSGESFIDEHVISGRTFITRGTPMRNAAGHVTSVLAVSYDITERKRMEDDLRRSEELLQGSIDALPDHIAILDRDGVILKVNRSWREFATANEYSGCDFGIGSNYLELSTPPVGDALECDEYGHRATEGIRDVIAERIELFSLEYPCNTPTEQMWFQMRVTKFSEGGDARVLITHENVTSRHLAEKAVRESEKKYRTLFQSIDEGFCVVEVLFDAEGVARDFRFEAVNSAFVRQTGMTDVVGKTMLDSYPDFEDFWFTTYGEVIATGESVRFENESLAMQRWYDVYAFPVDDPRPNRIGILFSDITERKKIERELQEAHDELEDRVAQRTRELAEVNDALSVEIEERSALEKDRIELVHKIVTSQEDERQRISRDLHDQLGQRLTALRLKLSSLHDVTGSDEEVSSRVERLQELADTLDGEVSFLASELRPTALDDFGLEDTLRSYTKEWSSHYETPVDFHSNVGSNGRLSSPVETHLYRIAQEALNNVIKHARATHVTVLLERTREGTVLVVEDNGAGFDAENAQSQKTDGGLGLVGMRERASLIGGEIEIETSAGSGTAIYVKVPDAF